MNKMPTRGTKIKSGQQTNPETSYDKMKKHMKEMRKKAKEAKEEDDFERDQFFYI